MSERPHASTVLEYPGGTPNPPDLPAAVRGVTAPPGSPAAVSNNFKQAKEQMILAFERDFITRALERHRGNVTRAAEEIGMYRQQLQTKVGKLGIDLESFRRS